MSDSSQNQPNNSQQSFKQKLLRRIVFMGLTLQSLIAILLGFLFGYLVNYLSPTKIVLVVLQLPGKIFINVLRSVVLFFIIFTMIRVPMEVGEMKKFKQIGLTTFVYFLATSVFASAISLLISSPLMGISISAGCSSGELLADTSKVDELSKNSPDALSSLFKISENAFPANLFRTASEENIIGLLPASLIFGFFLAQYKDTKGGRYLKKSLDTVNSVIIDIIHLIVSVIPIGVFSLVAGVMAEIQNFCIFAELFMYLVAFFVSAAVLIGGFYALVYYIVTRQNPYKYIFNYGKAILTGFSTSSSAAALPLVVKTALDLGIDKSVAEIVLPFGATANMDGSSLYYPATVIFVANAAGYSMTIAQKFLLCIVSALITIGAAPIPAGSLIFLLLVANIVGAKIDRSYVSIIWAIDPILDRFLTAINITGNAFSVKVVQTIIKRFKKKENNEKKSINVGEDKDEIDSNL